MNGTDAAIVERVAVVVPIRSFGSAKLRLAGVLDEASRSELVRRLAARVLDAARPHAVVVVTSDPDVAAFATARRAAVVADPGSLDASAATGRRWAAGNGFVRMIVLHADLPFVNSIDVLAAPGSAPVAVVVPDQRRDGTPALSIPTDAGFSFAYGAGSFDRHCQSALAGGLRLEVVDDPSIGFDVDLPEDLEASGLAIPSAEPS